MKKLRRIVSLCLSVAVIGGMLSACAGNNAKSEASASKDASGALKIGGIGPLSGDAAIYGVAVKNAAGLAINEINAAGGVNGMKLTMNFQDDQNDSEKATNAYNTLKDWGMQILMGTVTSTPCKAVAANANSDNMFLLTPSASAVDAIKYDNAFRVCFSDPNQGKATAQYISSNKLAEKVGVIYNSSDVYSTGIYEQFKTESSAKGLKVVDAEAFTSDNKTDFSVQLQKIQSAGADLVFLPIYYTEASLILKQANSKGYAPKFFGCDGLDGILSVDNFNKSLAENVMLLTPFAADAKDEKTQKFVAAYKKAYNNETPNQFAADAYDAIYTIKAALEEAGIKDASTDAPTLCKALETAMTKIKVTGVTGTITWSKDGEPSKTPKAVKIVNGTYVAMN